jgi:hypothetical protein
VGINSSTLFSFYNKLFANTPIPRLLPEDQTHAAALLTLAQKYTVSKIKSSQRKSLKNSLLGNRDSFENIIRGLCY